MYTCLYLWFGLMELSWGESLFMWIFRMYCPLRDFYVWYWLTKKKKQIMTMIFLFLKSINVDLLRQSASAKNIFITGITVSVLWFRLYSPKERKKINYLNNNITYNNNNYNKQCQIRIHKLFLFACFFCENSHKIVHEKKIQHIFF